MAVVLKVGNQTLDPLPMTWNPKKGQWELPEDKRPNNAQETVSYHFVSASAPDKPIFDGPMQQVDGFHRIDKGSRTPASTGATLLALQNAAVSNTQLDDLRKARENGNTAILKRTHFNAFPYDGFFNDRLLPLYQRAGFGMLETRPMIGGDNISNHGYWTTSLLQLNHSVPTMQHFETMLQDSLRYGVRMCFDGAFVNEGYQGIHYLNNLYHRNDSPYLKFFNYGKIDVFPDKKLKLGILPVDLTDIKKQGLLGDNSRWEIRFLDRLGKVVPKDEIPDTPGPYWVQIYDPRLEEYDKKPKAHNITLTHSEDSVQAFAFPITRNEFVKKVEALRLARINDPDKVTGLKAEWENFDFTTRAHDNSGYNWDGQRDVKKIDMDEPRVREYVAQSVTYWTDKVDRAYSLPVAKAIASAKTPQEFWDAVIASTKTTHDDGKILPALVPGQSHDDFYTLETIQQALDSRQKPDPKASHAQVLASTLRDKFNLGTLPAPLLLQGLFSNSKLSDMLQKGKLRFGVSWLSRTISPVTTRVFKVLNWLSDKKPETERWGNRLHRYLDTHWIFRQKSFYKQVQDKLESSLSKLPSAIQDKLKDPELARLVYDDLGRALFISLMTGRKYSFAQAKSVQHGDFQLAEQLYETLPLSVTDTSPFVAVPELVLFLRNKLNDIDLSRFNKDIEAALQGVTGESLAVARHVLNQRGFGLHWRVDAAKDLGDMDKVRNSKPEVRAQVFKQELKKAKDCLTEFYAQAKRTFPNMVINCELTDFWPTGADEYGLDGKPIPKSRDRLADEEFTKFMSGDLLDTCPDYNEMFNGILATIWGGYPDEFSGFESPEQFLGKAKSRLGRLPAHKAALLQGMIGNHDKTLELKKLMENPILARYDYYDWLPVIDGDRGTAFLALNELFYRDVFQSVRQNLPGLDQSAYTKLANLFQSAKTESGQPESPFAKYIRTHYPELHQFIQKGPTESMPLKAECRGQFVQAAFACTTPQDLGIEPQHFEALKGHLLTLVSEPSEYKGIRAKLTNTLYDLSGLQQEANRALPEQNKQAFSEWLQTNHGEIAQELGQALYQLGRQSANPRWLGYQPTDYVIDKAFEFLAQTQPQRIAPWGAENIQQLKMVWMNTALTGAFQRYQRMAAFQTSITGNPTYYLPTLYGQTGGEGAKNRYLGNRDAIRRDWVDTNPTVKQFQQQTLQWVALRNQHAVLNEGMEYHPAPFDANLENTQYYTAVLENIPHLKPILESVRAEYENLLTTEPKKLVNNKGEEISDELHPCPKPNERKHLIHWIQHCVSVPGNDHEGRNGKELFKQQVKERCSPGFSEKIKTLNDEIKRQQGIIPIVRDNGRDQMIVLLHAARNKSDGWEGPGQWWASAKKPDKPEELRHYPEVTYNGKQTAEPYQNYKLYLHLLGIPVGTRYKAVGPEADGNTYVVNEQHELVNQANGQGIDINIAKFLLRVDAA